MPESRGSARVGALAPARDNSPLLLNEPGPVNGRLVVPETPGFGVELNPDVARDRPFTH